MYTERFMKTLEQNPEGYAQAAVHNADGFKNVAGGVLIQHGTGDDNVHFQHSAVLVDTLVAQGVSPKKLDVMWFTDSEHSIAFHGSNAFLYKQLTKKLWEETQRGLQRGHQWDKKKERLHQWDRKLGV
jgi:dipeptidyl-peptidase-4